MRINHNIQALNTYKQLSINQKNLSSHLERLSSGLRINRASDDAAGLAISEKMRSQIRGLKVADRNALDGISMIQTAEGALGEVQNILQRMRELAVQAANGSLAPEDRTKIQNEIDQLTLEVDRISDVTNFNGKSLLAGNIDTQAFISCSSTEIAHGGGGTFNGTVTSTDNVFLNFLEIPAAGDSLRIDDVTINFASGTSSPYNAGTDTATIDILSKTVDQVVFEIKTQLDTAVATDPTAVDNFTGHYIVDNALVLEPSNLYIEYNDPDFAPKPAEDMTLDMQIGANEDGIMNIKVSNMDTASLGIARMADHTTIIATPGVNAVAGIDVSTDTAADAAISILDNALKLVTIQRSTLGAYQNRLEYTVTNLGTSTLNLTEAESRIRDADMAIEMTGFSKANILNQAATAMLAQANQMPQGVLQLLS